MYRVVCSDTFMNHALKVPFFPPLTLLHFLSHQTHTVSQCAESWCSDTFMNHALIVPFFFTLTPIHSLFTRHGYIIAVYRVVSIGEGKILPNRGQVLYPIVYKALVFRPFVGEVLDAIVTSVTEVSEYVCVFLSGECVCVAMRECVCEAKKCASVRVCVCVCVCVCERERESE